MNGGFIIFTLANKVNIVSSTILIGIKDCHGNHIINNWDKMMIAGSSVGLSWGGTVLKF